MAVPSGDRIPAQRLYEWMLRVRRDILAHEKVFDEKWPGWRDTVGVPLRPYDDQEVVQQAIETLGGVPERGADPGNPPMPPF